MNRKIALAALALAAVAGSASAEDYGSYNPAVQSSRSRADVQAELAQYRQAGVNPWSTSHNPLRSFTSTASRQQVTGEYLAARERVAAMTGEDSGSALLSRRERREVSTVAGQPRSAE